MIQLKTLNKRIATKSQGIFYKPVVNEEEKSLKTLNLRAILLCYNYSIKNCKQKDVLCIH